MCVYRQAAHKFSKLLRRFIAPWPGAELHLRKVLGLKTFIFSPYLVEIFYSYRYLASCIPNSLKNGCMYLSKVSRAVEGFNTILEVSSDTGKTVPHKIL